MPRHIFFHRVEEAVVRDLDVLHSDFVSVIDGWSATQREQQHCSDAALRGANTARYARLVVIAEYPVRPAVGWQRCFVFLHQPGQRLRMPCCAQQAEVEWQMKPGEVSPV